MLNSIGIVRFMDVSNSFMLLAAGTMTKLDKNLSFSLEGIGEDRLPDMVKLPWIFAPKEEVLIILLNMAGLNPNSISTGWKIGE